MVIYLSWDRWFDSWLMCRSILGKDTEPQVAAGVSGQLHGSSVSGVGVRVCSVKGLLVPTR